MGNAANEVGFSAAAEKREADQQAQAGEQRPRRQIYVPV